MAMVSSTEQQDTHYDLTVENVEVIFEPDPGAAAHVEIVWSDNACSDSDSIEDGPDLPENSEGMQAAASVAVAIGCFSSPSTNSWHDDPFSSLEQRHADEHLAPRTTTAAISSEMDIPEGDRNFTGDDQLVNYDGPAGQGRLLLVSLLENFCSVYDRDPVRNQRLFLVLCRRLSAMGILSSDDFLEEAAASTRNVYKRAFRELVLQAIQNIESSEMKLLKDALPERRSSQTTSPVKSANHVLLSPRSNAEASSHEEFFTGRSRYTEDFIEVDVIGRGGYGRVVMAQNRLDQRLYAIKKIHFPGVLSTRYFRIMREVKSLARLDHPNIVRYNSAWIEEYRPASTFQRNVFHIGCSTTPAAIIDGDSNTTDATALSSSSTDDTEDGCVSASMTGHDLNSSSRQLPTMTVFIQMEMCQFTLEDYLQQRNHLIAHGSPIHEYDTNGKQLHPHIKLERLVSVNKNKKFEINIREIRRVFKGVVKGLCHIHSHGLIHRDLKPANIFFQGEECIPKIGDFGLVTDPGRADGNGHGYHDHSTDGNADFPYSERFPNRRCFRTHHQTLSMPNIKSSDLLIKAQEDYSAASLSTAIKSFSISEPGDSRHRNEDLTSGVGTATYASPEQMNCDDYNEKSDIYSLGIICFELFHPFRTQMERVNILRDLKQHKKFPSQFVRDWPREATFIWSCITVDQDKRPSAAEILESEMLDHDIDEVMERLVEENENLRALLEHQSQIANDYRNRNYMHQVEITMLKKRVAELELFVKMGGGEKEALPMIHRTSRRKA